MTIRIRQDGERFLLPVKVTPKGGKNCILPYSAADEAIKLKVSAPPEDGKANTAVIALLAFSLKLPKSRIEVVSGHQSRHKQISITLDDASECGSLLAQLSGLLNTPTDDCMELVLR